VRLHRIIFGLTRPANTWLNHGYWTVKEYPEYVKSDYTHGFLCRNEVVRVFGFDPDNPPKKIQMVVYSCQSKTGDRKEVHIEEGKYVYVNDECLVTSPEIDNVLLSIPRPKVWVECKVL